MSNNTEDNRKSDASIQYHGMLLKSIQTNVSDLTKFMHDYQATLYSLSAQFTEHVKSCDVRSEEARRAMVAATEAIAKLTKTAAGNALTPTRGAPVQSSFDSQTAIFQKMPWWMKRLFDKAFDYAVFAVIFLIVFAWKHGAQLPIPGG